jgi:pimeloyl-ACP methyl ester carboxylesterase
MVMVAVTFLLSACTSQDTGPIVDEKGQVVAGSIARLEKIKLGGVDQWILIRGHKATNPIILKIHGGPGQAEMATRAMNARLEREFVVVEWDQRGAGKSADAIEPINAMTLDQIVQDTLELSHVLIARLDQPKIILVGSSWGSVVGMHAIAREPSLYRAFVSTGQIANFVEGMSVGFQFLLEEAARRHDDAAIVELKSIGTPPFLGPGSAAKRQVYSKWLEAYGAIWHSTAKFDRVGWMLSSVEYAWPEKLLFSRAADRSFDLLLPDLAKVNLIDQIPHVEVPVYFAIGRFDRLAPTQVSQTYFDQLTAPLKEWIWFENSAHFPQWEEVDQFSSLLIDRVLTETH